MRSVISVIALLISLCLLWLSAHDWYVSRINHHQQERVSTLQQGDYHLTWPLTEPSDLVSGFGRGWQWQQQGVQIKDKKSALSLAFGDRFLIPEIHRQLTFKWQPQQSNGSANHVFLEFSRVDSEIYYYSPLITLDTGVNDIDLNSLSWVARQNDRSKQVSWSSLPALNTLVWRFSGSDNRDISGILLNVKVHQSQPLSNIATAPPLSESLNNQLRHQWQSHRFESLSIPVMQPHLMVSPLVPYVVAILSLMLVVIIYQGATKSNSNTINKSPVLSLIALVATVAWLMQTNLLFSIFEHNPWIAIILLLLPTVLLVNRWRSPNSPAWPVWLLTAVMAVLMFALSGLRLDFVEALPVYLLWALAQQVIIGPMVSDYLHQKAGFSAIYTALICGVLFGLIHMPNQMLMLATFVGGCMWSYAWLRYQNIYANAVSHALLALLFYQAMPTYLLGSARVGLWF